MEERIGNVDVRIESLINNIEKVIVGKRPEIEMVISAMLAGGHVLIEDVPGVGKTQLVSAIAKSCNSKFGRIQLTPDVMPSDITGYTMINQSTNVTEFRPGVTFCNFLLADELNRASPKSQSALLEVMEEGQVTVDGSTYLLPKPFMVLATQNPVETFGTYHLPEAQMDRFIMKISLGYPNYIEELDILTRNENKVNTTNLEAVVSSQDIVSIIDSIPNVTCSESIKQYIVNIVNASRKADYIKLPISPRGSIALYKMCKAYAYVKGRNHVLPDDVKRLAPYVLAHRLILTPKGKSICGNNEGAIAKLLVEVEVAV